MASQSHNAHLLHEGQTALKAGSAQTACSLLEEFLAHCDDIEARDSTEAHITLGEARSLCGDFSQALQHLLLGYRQAHIAHDPHSQARALKEMALVDYRLGDLVPAIERLYEARDQATASADAGLEASVLHQLGMVHGSLGHFDDAEKCYLQAIEKHRARDDLRQLGISFNGLGVLNLHRGNAEAADAAHAAQRFEQARVWFEQALDLAQKVGDHHLFALANGNIGCAAGSLGALEVARRHFTAQCDSLRVMGDRLNLALALTNLGESWRRQNHAQRALEPLGEALSIAREIKSLPRQRAVHAEFAQCLELIGDFGQALSHHKAYHAIDCSIRSSEAERTAAQASSRMAIQQIRAEADAQRQENDRLQNDIETLTREATTDQLTGLLNRRSFDRMLSRFLSRRHEDLALVMLDLDHFKKINDEFSHLVGDLVLQRTATVMMDALRPGEHVFRVGGEEFVILLPQTGLKGASSICERIRQAVEQYSWGQIDSKLRVTASFGLAPATPTDSAESLLRRADLALYSAKKSGRNQVVIAEP